MTIERENKKLKEIESERFYGVLDSCIVIEEKTIENILILPRLKWIFHQKLYNYHETSYGTPYTQLEYLCIDEDKAKKIFEYKGVRGIDFKEELACVASGPGYNRYLSCKILDLEENIRDVTMKPYSFGSVFNELIELFELLSKYKSWDNYDLFINNKMLKREVINLKNSIQSQEKRIQNLREGKPEFDTNLSTDDDRW